MIWFGNTSLIKAQPVQLLFKPLLVIDKTSNHLCDIGNIFKLLSNISNLISLRLLSVLLSLNKTSICKWWLDIRDLFMQFLDVGWDYRQLWHVREVKFVVCALGLIRLSAKDQNQYLIEKICEYQSDETEQTHIVGLRDTPILMNYDNWSLAERHKLLETIFKVH